MPGNILTVPVRRFHGAASPTASARGDQDLLAVEEPLQIRIGTRNLAVTMRTPGHDAELAVGFLYSEGLIRQAGDIAYIKCERNTALVTPADGVEIEVADGERNFYMTSSCGVCGKASVEALE